MTDAEKEKLSIELGANKGFPYTIDDKADRWDKLHEKMGEYYLDIIHNEKPHNHQYLGELLIEAFGFM